VICVENFLIKPQRAYLREGLSFPFTCTSMDSVKWYYLGRPSQYSMKIVEYAPKKKPRKGLYRCVGHIFVDNLKSLFYADGLLIHSSKIEIDYLNTY